ncbi:hypothetical protein [Vibrio gallicus]|uniref:hypothetical protein n=1 Tax=Vibrio gallicus TaxID=190897 RepID=UPI0021C2A6A4|nr:hypothetical protein [Vibrio gallicus]
MQSKISALFLVTTTLLYLPYALGQESETSHPQPWLTPEASPHKVFVNADSSAGIQFDVWQMDTGYSYSVMDNIDLYIATRITNSADEPHQRGFLSGMNYHFNDKLSLNSAIYTSPASSQSVNNAMSAEVSGKYMLTDTLNVKATLDYEEWQSGVEVKLGFSF